MSFVNQSAVKCKLNFIIFVYWQDKSAKTLVIIVSLKYLSLEMI